MTHRERVLATFAFQETDRAPYDLMEGSVWAELLDYFTGEHGLSTTADVFDFLDTDFRWQRMADTRKDQAGLGELPTTRPAPDGSLSKTVAQGALADAERVAEVEAYAWVDPADFVPADYHAARRQWPDHALVFSAGWWPLFWGACEAFGVESALCNLAARPALFEAAVRSIHDRYMDRLRRGLDAARGACDICWLGDDFATQESMFLSPDDWRRFIKPALAEQVALARNRGMLVLYHSCGSVRPVLGDLIDIGVNGLLVFQTTARDMDAASISREFGGKLAFYGGTDVQRILSFATPAEVRAEVGGNLSAFRRCGGYVVANSHHRVATIRGDLIEAMCATARDSGPMASANAV